MTKELALTATSYFVPSINLGVCNNHCFSAFRKHHHYYGNVIRSLCNWLFICLVIIDGLKLLHTNLQSTYVAILQTIVISGTRVHAKAGVIVELVIIREHVPIHIRSPNSVIILHYSSAAPTINIISSPAGTPVSGSINTYDYPILSSVTLMCLLDPLPSTNVTYSWNTTRCYRNTNYAGGSSRCFPSSQTTQNVTGYNLTAEDAGTITCTVTIKYNEYTSGPYTLRISSKLLYINCVLL